MIQDAGSGAGFILYGINNLPLQTFKTSGSSYTYLYDVAGNRVYSSGSGQYYVNGVDGKTEAVVQKTATQKITHNIWASGLLGQVKRDGSTLTRFYDLKDHLGSIRAIVSSNGTIDSYSDYFPFGQLMDGRSLTGSSDTRYKYTEKERDVETGYDYFGARYFDARIGRFETIDRFSEKYPTLAPYSYAAGNPIRYVDYNGDSLWVGQNAALSLGYLRSMHPEFSSRLSVSADGLVSFDTEGLDIQSDAALELMNNLVNGGCGGEYAGLRFLFEVSNHAQVTLRNGNSVTEDLTKSASGIENVSMTHRLKNAAGFAPRDGYSGQVTMGTGSWSELSTNSVVFHELSENFYRTAKGEHYAESPISMPDGTQRDVGGAHEHAIIDAVRYAGQKGDLWKGNGQVLSCV